VGGIISGEVYYFLAGVSDPGPQSQEGSIFLKFLVETRLKLSLLSLWLAF